MSQSQILKMLTDEQRVVTTKYCSHRLHTGINESKQALQSVYDAHKAESHVVPVFAVCYRQSNEEDEENGVERVGNKNKTGLENKFCLKLVQGEQEADEVASGPVQKELHALAPHAAEDIASQCFSADCLCMRQMLNDDPQCFAVVKSDQLKVGGVVAVPSQPEQPVKTTQMVAKPTATKKEPEKEKKQNVGSKTTKTAASFFGKQTAGGAAPKKAAAEAEAPKKESPPVVKKKSPLKKKDDEEETIGAKKSKKVRRIIDDDDDDEDDKSGSGADVMEVEEPAVEEAPKAVEEPQADEPKANEPIAVEESKAPSHSEGGARKLVERTYVDDEGYFVTEKTWKHDAAPAAAAAAAPQRREPAKPPAHTAPKASKAKAAKSAAGGKQTSLTSFFKKA